MTDGALHVELVGDTPRARWAKAALEDLARRHDLRPFLRTTHVQIDPALGGGRSHPVLTLGLGHADCEFRLLSLLLHEQMHWHLCDHEPALDKAMAEFEARWPDPPADAAANRYSIYLHVAVNWLELRSLASLIGDDEARRVVAGHRYYRWINHLVLDHEAEVGAIMDKHGVPFPDPTPPGAARPA